MLLPANWTVSATEAEITLTSSAPVEKVAASDWWDVTAAANEPISNFSAGYTYDISASEYKAGNSCSMNISDFKLP